MTPCSEECVQPTKSQAHCSDCHLTFGGVSTFDKHRVEGNCREPENLKLVNGVWRRELTWHGIEREPVEAERRIAEHGTP